MELNSGKSSSIEDYSLITQEKCSPPRAKLFMVTIISFVVATLVVLLVVLTQVEQKTTPTENYSEPDVCPDVAIIGGGLAGAYAAYRLAAMNFSIQLFEMSNRIGGRMLTSEFPNTTDAKLELGEAYWVPRLHRKMDALVGALNLTKVKYLRAFDAKELVYNLRNMNLRAADLNSSRSPYNLDPIEQKKYPYELYRWYLEGDQVKPPTSNETDRGDSSNNIQLDVSLDDLLADRASPEGAAFVKATTEPHELHGEGDSGLFFDYLLALGDYITGAVGERVTVEEGMESVPSQLLSDVPASDRWNVINQQHRLTKIESENGIHRLYFALTQEMHGGTQDTEDTEFTCAKSIVLAIPPKSLHQVTWAPLTDDPTLSQNLHSVIAVPAMKIFLAYDTPWWGQLDRPWRSVRTDLPLKRVDVIREADVNDTNGGLSVIMASFVANEGQELWNSMLATGEGEVFQGSYNCHPPVTVEVVDHLQRYLARISGTSPSLIPYPVYATQQQWEDYPHGGAWHVWRPGADWTVIAGQMLRPGNDQNIHIVGSAFAQSHLQFTQEGALQTVDNLIDKYFQPVGPPFGDLMNE